MDAPAKQRLNPTNPDHITYTHLPLEIAVLGGVRTDILDRMRATLKIQVEHLSLRHNLDLYNDNQVERLVRKVAERLEIGTSVVAAALQDLTDQLERYRLEEKERQELKTEEPRKLLSPDVIKEHKLYLGAPNLMERTGQDLVATGIIGEEINALVLYMVMTSRKCADPLSAISLARSGVGKSYLQERVAACMPIEDIFESSQITESSFYRFGRKELRGKIFLIEDLDGAQAVLYPIGEMQTKKRISKTVTVKDSQGRLKTVTLVVEGPVSVCGCTTRESIYEDNANRSLLLHLDGSRAQDEKVMEYQKRVKAGLIDTTEEEKLRELMQDRQRVLVPVKVVNPYALQINLPGEVFKPRRTLGLLLSFIEAITFYHQYQREKQYDTETGEEFIETTPEDIEWAFKLLRDVLFRKSDELSGACREFYEWLKAWATRTTADKFFGSDIRKENRINPRTLNRYLQELAEYGKLQITGGNKHKTGYQYQITDGKDYESLQNRIDRQISQVLEEVKQAAQERASKPAKKKVSGTA